MGGSFTVDGRQDVEPRWGLPINKFDPSTMNPTVQYTQAFAQGAGIDQNELLYIGVLENRLLEHQRRRADGGSSTSTSATPVQLSQNTV